jgi:hypothetical protein
VDRLALIDPDPDRTVKAAHAAVYREGGARAHGGGVLTTGGAVLTCAHVVNLALGRDPFETAPPPLSAGLVDGLLVGLPGHSATTRHRVRLDRWQPPLGAPGPDGDRPADGAEEWYGDIVRLRLADGPPPGAGGAPLGTHRTGTVAYTWYGSGHQSTVAAVVIQAVTDRWLVLDAPLSAQPVVEGYSGAPLWDRDQQCVVGLVVSRRAARAFAIPAAALTGDIPRARDPHAGPPVPPAREPTAPAGPGWTRLVGAVHRLLPAPAAREECARRLAAELSLPAPAAAPGPEWLVLAALSAPHGVPTLLGLLPADDPALRDDLELAALYTAPDDLLTAAEWARLRPLLTGRTPAPGRIGLTGLPLGLSLDGLDWTTAVRTLEGYRPRHGGLPVLLRLTDEAARHPDAGPGGPELADWTTRVAERLALTAALAGDRERAAAAARTRAAAPATENAPVVQLLLYRSGTDDRFTFTVRATGAAGGYGPPVCQDTPAPRSALLARLAAVLADAGRDGPPGAVPRIECVVEKDELDLDPDQWIYRADDLFPSILGEDFELVLRCPSLRRPEYLPELRYRWQTRHTGRVLVQHGPDPAVRERGSAAPVCAVALCCPPAGTPRLRAVAIGSGVPGVLWARPGAPATAPAEVARLAAGLTADALPSAVYRARLRADEHPGARHLSLLWDGPEGLPQPLTLSDPDG